MAELGPYILLISKPFGITSFQFTDKVRKILKARKAGHTGTLDPMATGLMVIALNGATRFIPFINTNAKEYVIQVLFGVETDTDDITGNIINENNAVPDINAIRKALGSFTGNIKQKPPIFSAKKVKGKRLYKYARDGENVAEIKEVDINIYRIEVLSFNRSKLNLRVLCSKGTYMRSLARDLGHLLNTFATLSAISRTRVGKFSIEQATSLSFLSFDKKRGFIKMEDAIDLPSITINNKNKFMNGVDIETNFIIVRDKKGSFLGIGKIQDGKIHPDKVINENI